MPDTYYFFKRNLLDLIIRISSYAFRSKQKRFLSNLLERLTIQIGVIKSSKSKKDRQYNGQNKKDKQ